GEVNVELESDSKKLREKLRQDEDTEEEAFKEFSSTLDNGEVNVELESDSKKLREKLRQDEDTEEEAFKEFSSTLDNVLEKISQENKSPYDFYSLMYDTDDDASISGKSYLFVVHERVTEEVIEMANDQAEALSSDKEVTDECLDDKQVGESRPSKRIRVTKEEMVKDQKSKKA
nr:hypothetical protein [Tanacetum cinerariifolium]